MPKLHVKDREVAVFTFQEQDYISLTDIARYKSSDRTDYLIQNWLRNRNTIEFLGIWEQHIYPSQNKTWSGCLSKSLWSHIRICSRHDLKSMFHFGTAIAFEFASWISVEFKLYLIKEFQRLKEAERKTLGWDIRRNLAKMNYRIHTDAIQRYMIPPELTPTHASVVYATEADLLNVALFGLTSSEWRRSNPDKSGNIRDYADMSQLVCLSNLENSNALFIENGLTQGDRLKRLNEIAIQQMVILANRDLPKLSEGKA